MKARITAFPSRVAAPLLFTASLFFTSAALADESEAGQNARGGDRRAWAAARVDERLEGWLRLELAQARLAPGLNIRGFSATFLTAI